MVCVRLSGWTGTAGNADDGDAGLRLPVPAQIVGKTHAIGWIALHGVDSAVRSAGSNRHHGPRFRRQAVDPIAGRNGLPRDGIGAEGGPVAFFLIRFVRDGAFHHQDKWSQLLLRRKTETAQEFVAILHGENGIMEPDFGNPGDGAEQQILDARLCGRG